ncbi:helix-turn-helix domain-containing protein [Eubacteriales bacterium KG126]
MAYAFKMIRAQSGMNRKDFSAWLGIPYRTMQEWELGRRAMLEYVLRLIAYKVQMEGPYNDSIVWYWNSF